MRIVLINTYSEYILNLKIKLYYLLIFIYIYSLFFFQNISICNQINLSNITIDLTKFNLGRLHTFIYLNLATTGNSASLLDNII